MMHIYQTPNKKDLTPILYSFRRCPYAMRARLAILSSKTPVIIREISLKNKPENLLCISPLATVPCLQTANKIITESMYIMLWALGNNDPKLLLDTPKEGNDIIHHNDSYFKTTLDRIKYSSSLEGIDIVSERKEASKFLYHLNGLLTKRFLFGDKETLADIAILPFIRQYALIDRTWFNEQKWPNLINWLDRFLESPSFTIIQTRYPIWVEDQKPVLFPT
jgi:glutathione S-transferase